MHNPALPCLRYLWNIPRVSGSIALLFTTVSLAGCNIVRDGIATIIGAPTEAEVAAVLGQVKEAEATVAQLEADAAEADETQAEQAAEAERLSLQSTVLRSQIGQIAAQLSEATGVAWAALQTTFQNLTVELEALEQGIDAHKRLAADYAKIATRIRTEVEAQKTILEDAELELDGFDERTRQAVHGATEGVRLASEAAQNLGVPGAKLIGDQIAATGSGLLALVLGGGTALQTVRHRRERRRRRGLDEVVHANEEFGLIKDDAEAKEKARLSLSAAASTALALAKVNGAGATT